MATYEETKDARIKKRNDVYWARFMKRGVYVQESLSTKSFQVAVRLVEEIERCILLGVKWRKDKELFGTAWHEFMSDKAKGIKTRIVRDRTLAHYISFGERYFLPFYKDIRVGDMDEDSFVKYVEWVRGQNPTIIFFNQRKYILSFLAWAERKGKIQKRPDLFDPDARAELDEDTDDATKIFSESELLQMRSGSLFLDREPFRLYLFMAMFMGMRSSEISQLQKNRIDWPIGVIRLRAIDTKNKESRTVPIHPRVWAMLRLQCDASQDSKFVFQNFRRVGGDRAMDRTGFKKPWNELRSMVGTTGKFHYLKHTFITTALARGMNPVIVSKIVGTSIRVIEKVYLHLKDEDLCSEVLKFKM